jgi:ribonuclease BN (tRNA processing enzyme)
MMLATRRQVIQSGAALTVATSFAGLGAGASAASEHADRLVLLGTRGGPFLTAYGATPSANLLVYHGVPYVIDTGYGVTLKLLRAGVSLDHLSKIFITHHHSDHNLELGPLIYNAWVAGLRSALDVYGPSGLRALLTAYWQSMAYDLAVRVADEGRPKLPALVSMHEYSEGLITENGQMRVSALRNHHPPVTESYSLKFEFGGKKVVFSGDTAYLPQLAEFADGADYLVHEVFYPGAVAAMLKDRPNAPSLGASIRSHHTSPEDVGRIATKAKVGTLVLTHFVPADERLVSPTMWADAVRKTFNGRIVVGKDMMSFDL